MTRKSLYIMAVLLYSAVEVDAMSLKETLQSENIVLNFENGGTIWCESLSDTAGVQYSDRKGFAPHPGYINKSEYLYDGNTYYLPLNTLLIQSNTSIGGGV